MMLRRVGTWLAAAVVASVVWSGCAEEKAPPVETPQPQEVTFASSDSAHLAGTWTQVKESRVVVICIPTVNFTRASWANTTQLLTKAGWSVLLFDLRGQGESHVPPGSNWQWSPSDTAGAIDLFVKDIRGAVQFARQTAGNNVKVVLLGADIAGVAGLYAATAEPQVTGVALVTPPGGLSNLIAGRLIERYGDRPLLVMSELPVGASGGTPCTTDSWLGRGSAITLSLTAPKQETNLESKQAALNMLVRWITSTAIR